MFPPCCFSTLDFVPTISTAKRLVASLPTVNLFLTSLSISLMYIYSVPANPSSVPSLFIGFFDLLMRAFQIILEVYFIFLFASGINSIQGLSIYWAVRLTMTLRTSGPTRSAAYGELGTDDFNVYSNNYEFKSSGTGESFPLTPYLSQIHNLLVEKLFDSDSDLSLGSSDEDDDQPIDLDF